MHVTKLLNLFPQHAKIGDRCEYEGVPGLYFIRFKWNMGYVGVSRNIGRRVKDFRHATPLLRFLGINPEKYDIYFLCSIKNERHRLQTEKRIVQKFAKCLNNIEYLRDWEINHR